MSPLQLSQRCKDKIFQAKAVASPMGFLSSQELLKGEEQTKTKHPGCAKKPPGSSCSCWFPKDGIESLLWFMISLCTSAVVMSHLRCLLLLDGI